MRRDIGASGRFSNTPAACEEPENATATQHQPMAFSSLSQLESASGRGSLDTFAYEICETT